MRRVRTNAEYLRAVERGDLKRLDNLRRSLDIMTKQMSIQDAAKHFNVSEKTIRRRIDQSKLKAEKDNGRWIVHVDGQEFQTNDQTALIVQLQSENEYFREQNESLIQQLGQAQQLLAVSQKSILHLTEQNQLLLEDTRKRTWWKRIFRR